MEDEDRNLLEYYKLRAKEYEYIYQRDDPVRQAEQLIITDAVRHCFQERNVLEVACGTGFWTWFLADVANHVTGIDASPEMLEIARKKGIPPHKVSFLVGDVYDLDSVPGEFNGGLCNFWFSHVPKARIPQFLEGFHRRLRANSVVFMADNMLVPGIGGELLSKDGEENTFKVRMSSSGAKYEIIKNYYTTDELQRIFEPWSKDLEVHSGYCFWWVKYMIAKNE